MKALPSATTKAVNKSVPAPLKQLKHRDNLCDYLFQINMTNDFNFPNIFVNMITMHYEGDLK